jgi:DHA2 family multidrug resistance protein
MRRFLIVLGVMMAALLQTLDATIVNVALPTIQGNLGASIDEGTWVVTAYVIAAVIVIPITPWLQLRLGRKQYFLISIAGFTAASMACGLVGSIDELIIFRIVQGLFGGGLLVTSQAILRDTFPASQFGLSQAIYTIAAVVGPSAGPTLGGLLTDNVSWRWVFDVNVVPGIIAFVILLALLRNPAKAQKKAIDLTGLFSLAIAVGSLQFLLDEGERRDWFNDPSIVLCALLAVVGGAFFTWWELRGTNDPIVDLRILRNRAVIIGVLLAMANAALVFGQLLILPQFFDGLGYTATQEGMLIALRALPIMLLTIPIGRIVASGRIPSSWMIAGGLAVAGFGSIGFSQNVAVQTSFGTVGPWLALTGIGISFVFTPLLVSVLGAVPRTDSAKAGSFISLALQLGGSIASASMVTLLDRREAFHSTVLDGTATLAQPAVSQFMTHGTPAQLAQIIAAQSAALSYADCFFVLGIIAIVCAPLAFLLRRKV